MSNPAGPYSVDAPSFLSFPLVLGMVDPSQPLSVIPLVRLVRMLPTTHSFDFPKRFSRQ